MSIQKSLKRKIAYATAGLMIGGAASFSANAEQWNEISIFTDPSSLDEKMQRFHSDEVYRSAVEELSTKDHESGFTENLANDETHVPERYIVFWDAYLNPALDLNMVVSFGGMDTETLNSTAHNKNMKHVIDCRDEVLSQDNLPSRYLQFMKIRGCASDSIAEMHADHKELMAHVYADPAPLQEKLNQYETSRINENGGDYYNAVKNRTQAETDSFAPMYHTSLMTLWHTMLDTSVSWDDIKTTPNENDQVRYEFTWADATTATLDNNAKYLFECRDALLPTDVSQDLAERVELYKQVRACWTDKSVRAHNAFKDNLVNRAENPYGDTTPLDQKLRDYNNGRDNDLYEDYRDAISALAKKNYNYSNMRVGDIKDDLRLWHVHLDTSIDAKTFLGSVSKPHDFALSTTSSDDINDNMQFLFDCRDDILGTTPLNEIPNASQAFHNVNQCATDKIAPIYEAHQNQWKKNLMNNLMITGGVLGVGFISVMIVLAGVKGYKKYKARPKKHFGNN